MDFDDKMLKSVTNRKGKVKGMSKASRRAVIQNIGHLTQLGFSIAFPPIICTMGALWLQKRLELGSWVVLVGVLFGMISGISCFMTFARSMVIRSSKNLYVDEEERKGD